MAEDEDNDEVLGFESVLNATEAEIEESTDDDMALDDTMNNGKFEIPNNTESSLEENVEEKVENSSDDEEAQVCAPDTDSLSEEESEEWTGPGGALNGDYYEESETGEYNPDDIDPADVDQSQAILNAEPSNKNEKVNKGNTLNRNKILLVISFVAVIFILLFTMIFPAFKTRKKKETVELDKADTVYVPKEITYYQEPTEPKMEDGNSYLQNLENEKSMEEKFPPIEGSQPMPQQNIAPVQVPSKSSGSSQSDFPITNRNEQQKQMQRLSLNNRDNNPAGQYQNNNSKYNYPSGYGPTGTNSYNTAATYTPTSLTANLDKYGIGNTTDSYTRQNNQSGKQQFINQGNGGGNYQWNSEYSLWKGTIISAVLDTGINTDLPGQVMAHVTKNVYSSQDGKYLLIPMGSRLFGSYNSDISYGQRRVQVVWNTLIRPDGLEINLGSLNGIDDYGFSGYKGFKTEHPFEYGKAMGLIAMYSILDTGASKLAASAQNDYAQNTVNDVYAETKKLNNKIVDRALDIQPTIIIQSGKEISLITNLTMDIPPLEPYEVTEKYVRE